MLYDLNVLWTPSTPAAELDHTLRLAKHLGYDVVALNHIVHGPGAIPNAPAPVSNPIPRHIIAPPPPPGYQPDGPAPRSSAKNLVTDAAASSSLSQSTTTTKTTTTPSHLPTTLRRVTLVVHDPATTNYRLADHARAFDLLAVRPTTQAAFSWACLAAADPPALISLDLAVPLGWHLQPRTAMAAVARGSRFEICYGHLIAGSSSGASGASSNSSADPGARAAFIANVLALVRVTKGRGIVVSSEARAALHLRAPADAVNMLAVWGLAPDRGGDGLSAGARAVVVNEGIKRSGFRGVVDIVQLPDAGSDLVRHGDGEGRGASKVEGGGGVGGAGGKQQKQQKGTSGQQGEKRKNADGAGMGDGQGQQPLSKRQAKRMKKAKAAGT